MIKWFYKLCSKVAGFAASLGIDGLTHIIVMTIISKMALIFLPVWVMVAVMLLVAVSKELLDRFTGQGTSEWKNFFCDVAGILIAMI